MKASRPNHQPQRHPTALDAAANHHMSHQKYTTRQYPRAHRGRGHASHDARHAPWASSDYIAEPDHDDADEYISPRHQHPQHHQHQYRQHHRPEPPRPRGYDHDHDHSHSHHYSSMAASSSPAESRDKAGLTSSPYQPGYRPRWPARPRHRTSSPGSDQDYIADSVQTEDDYIATPAKSMPGAFVDDDTPDYTSGSAPDSSPPHRPASVPRSISRRRSRSKPAASRRSPSAPRRSPSAAKRSPSNSPSAAVQDSPPPPPPDVAPTPEVTPPSPKPLQRPVSRHRRWDAPASPPRRSPSRKRSSSRNDATPPSPKPLQRHVSRPKRWDAPSSPRRHSPRRRSPRRRSLKPHELENLREAQEFLERFRAIQKKLSQPQPAEPKVTQPKRWDAPASPPRRGLKPHELEHLKEAQELLRQFREHDRARARTPPPPEPPQPQRPVAQPSRWDQAPLPPRRRSLKPHELEKLREAQEFLKRFRAMEKTLSQPKPPQPQPEAPQPQPDSPSRWDHAPLPPRRRSLKPHELDNFAEAREFLERFRALDVQHKPRRSSHSSAEYHSDDSDSDSAAAYQQEGSPERRRRTRYLPLRQSRRDIYEAGFSHPPESAYLKPPGPAYSDTASYRSESLSGGASRVPSTARSYASRSPISRRPRLLRVRDRSQDSGRSRSVPARLRLKSGRGAGSSDTDDNGLGEGSDYLPSDESETEARHRRHRHARFSDDDDDDDDEDEHERERDRRGGGGGRAKYAYSDDDDNGVGEGSDYLSSDDDDSYDPRSHVHEDPRPFHGYRTTIHRGYRPGFARYGY
ncbi:hypothetical protein ACJQWK_03486 [Exserohilum turcicum]